jgi:redox-sensing transcriptional repressor
MPAYLRLLRAWEAEGREAVSCTHLSEALGIEPTLIRKDLQLAGASGRPKTGYRLAELVPALEGFLGWSRPSEAFVIGAGNLGLALLHYQGFAAHGLSVVAAFDDDQRKIGTTAGGKRVFPMAKLADLAQRMGVRLAVLCVPDAAAQEVADRCCAAGMRGLWNFTGARLRVPDGVVAETIDLAQSLALLSHRLAHALAGGRRAIEPPGTTP